MLVTCDRRDPRNQRAAMSESWKAVAFCGEAPDSIMVAAVDLQQLLVVALPSQLAKMKMNQAAQVVEEASQRVLVQSQ